MTNDTIKQTFLEAANDWVCDGYSLDIRFIVEVNNNANHIWDASIALNPIPGIKDQSFRIESNNFIVGQIQKFKEKKNFLIDILKNASKGVLTLPEKELILPKDRPYEYYSEMSYRNRWFSQLHLQVISTHRPLPSADMFAIIDNTLRASQPPFDGLQDVASWLDLSAPGSSDTSPSIGIRVGPPVDLIFEKCTLSEDQLRLILHAHPKFDVSHVSLAVRAIPGNALDTRKQISNDIKWSRVRDGRREGKVQIKIQNADNVLAMLMIGNSTVRRQWFIDPAKARNYRLLAMQYFDKDLRMVKQAVLDSPDSQKFEQGVSALLYLLGFSPCIQIETDSPDLIVTTPNGKLAIIECTTRIKDFATKIGKLVDRRGALSKSLQASGHSAMVYSVLVCRLPRDQIAGYDEEIRSHNTILITGEDLVSGLDKVRFPSDPDHLLEKAHDRITKFTALASKLNS